MTRPLRDVPARADLLLPALAAALDGGGPAVRPVPAELGSPTVRAPAPDAPDAAGQRTAAPAAVPATVHGIDPRPSRAAATVPDTVAVVVPTSGSTGEPRDVLLSADALRASGTATADRLSGPGHWLLALPAHHVAGLQVLVRSLLAGTIPVVLDPGPFRAPAFVAATARLDGEGPRYTSLVPTQLVRLLDDAAATDALRGYHAVLLGGAATPPALLARARAAGVRVVTTYGMSETCGGCVYDGVPLDGVHVALDDAGRVLLGGPVLADGYRDRPDLDRRTFVTRAGRRWLRTSDLGRLDGDVLHVLGRADDVLVTGGVNVAPAAVEAVIGTLEDVAEVCVVGVPDPSWGQAVVAVVVPRAGTAGPTTDEVRALVSARLGPAHAPRHVVPAQALPLRGPGKPDRRAAVALASARLAAPHTPHAAPGSPSPTERTDA